MSDTNDELSILKARADRLGLQYHPSIGVEKLREKVSAALAGNPEKADGAGDKKPDEPAAAVAAAPAMSPAMLRKLRKEDMLSLVRIRLTCMNPAKRELDGEIITCGNALVGTVRKYIPFHADEGWHVPKIMLEVLKARQCQIFVGTKTKGGVTKREGKLIKEFSIEILPQLTTEELHDLAQRQAMSQSVG